LVKAALAGRVKRASYSEMKRVLRASLTRLSEKCPLIPPSEPVEVANVEAELPCGAIGA